MVAFMLDLDTAKQLALPGGEPASILHVTLAFLGDKNEVELDYDTIRKTLAAFASESMPLQGTTGGVGRFSPSDSSDGLSPIISLVNVPGLQKWRAALVQRLESIGVQVASDFDYTPHITLAYIPQNAPMPIESIPSIPLVFDRLCLAVGGDLTSFPMGDEQYPDYWEAKDRARRASQTASTEQASEQERRAEYRRWKERAIDDVKRGRAQRGFTTTILSEDVHKAISSQLAGCSTVEDVRAVFDRAKERESEADEYRRWLHLAIEDMQEGRKKREFPTRFIPDYVRAYLSFELETCRTANDVHALFRRVQSHQQATKKEVSV
jgi:2'-5' RNA ligase